MVSVKRIALSYKLTQNATCALLYFLFVYDCFKRSTYIGVIIHIHSGNRFLERKEVIN